MLLLSLAIGTIGSNYFAARLLSAVILGIFQGRCGWLMHEAGHHSMTGNPNRDRLLQKIMYVVFLPK